MKMHRREESIGHIYRMELTAIERAEDRGEIAAEIERRIAGNQDRPDFVAGLREALGIIRAAGH